MVFEKLYQELARGAELIPMLVADMTQAEAQVRPRAGIVVGTGSDLPFA